MARRPRLCGEGLYHHVYAWGNNRQAIFVNNKHYERYLDFLEKYTKGYRVDIVAYALMQAHIHLFVYDFPGNVSQFMNSLHGEYAQYYNHVTGRVGHVFGERFNNKVVQLNVYGLWLSRYIHRQAVEANLVADPREYPWSSYNGYIGEASLGFLKPNIILEQFGAGVECIGQYKAFVLGTASGPIDWDMRSATVIGDAAFQQEVLEKEIAEHQENLNDKDIYQLINAHFTVKPELLFGARGLSEKRLRRKIIRYLIDEVGLRPARVAQICHISRSGVQRALNTEM